MKTKGLLFALITSLLLVSFFLFVQGDSNIMSSGNINLPEDFNGWKLEGQPRFITESNIFEYMNGAGELYLGYHFDHLSVYEYRDTGGNTIVVELYQMEDSRDAFGLLSLDWDGEPVELSLSEADNTPSAIIPPYRALYGKGLLRAWSDDLYIRIMAYKESAGVKEVILKLGQLITADRKNPSPPDFLKVIKPSDDSKWTLNKERTSYFYSHLVLNSFFYLSHENILNLGPSSEAVIVTFAKPEEPSSKRSVPLLVLKYPDHESASAALHDFLSAYLPELTLDENPEKDSRNRAFIKIEDGWMGYRLFNNHLALAFACPDQPSAFEILSQAALE